MSLQDERPVEVPRGWPERIIELVNGWKNKPSMAPRDEVLGELWTLINAALKKYLRVHQGRYGPVEFEVARDIASEKSLELLTRFDGGDWNPAVSTPAQLCAFVSTLARNGLIDHIRVHRSKRTVQIGSEGDDEKVGSPARLVVAAVPADVAVVRRQFAESLRDCVAQLKPRHRNIWFMRVLLEMPSKKIAAHPRVGMVASAVDVALGRTRAKVRDCMSAKGHDTNELPPGTFTALWEVFRSDPDTE